MVEQEQPNQRNGDNSNPQQSATSTRNNNNECRPTSIEPEQDLNAVNNVSASARNHPHEYNKTASVGSITNPPAHPRQSLKIPPSQKDDRKLFVGGLPADSKYYTSRSMTLVFQCLVYVSLCRAYSHGLVTILFSF